MMIGDILVDVDAIRPDVLNDGVHELIDADAREDVDVLKDVPSDVGVVELVVRVAAVKHGALAFEDVLVDVDAVKLNVYGDGVHRLVNADVVEDVDVLKEVLSDNGVVELFVLDVAVEHGVLAFEDVLVDVDAVNLDIYGDCVHGLVNVVEDVDVLKEVLSDVGVVELIVPDVAVKHGGLAFEDVLVDADAVNLNVYGDGVHGLVNADVREDVDVLKEVLSDVGVVEQVVPDVRMKHGVIACEDVLVDADGVKQDDVLRDGVRELIDAD
eukprot:5053988-Amphidinium_carterae.1